MPEKVRDWVRANGKVKEAMLTEIYCKIMKDSIGGDVDEDSDDVKMSDKSTEDHANLDCATYMESWSFAKSLVSYESVKEFLKLWEPLLTSIEDLNASFSS